MFKFLIASFVLSLLSFVSSTPNYCNINTCQGKPHLMCSYPLDQAASECGRVISNIVSEPEKLQILKELNDACDLQNNSSLCFEWNDELAKISKRWTNLCTYEQNYCANTETLSVAQIGSIAQNTSEILSIEALKYSESIKNSAQQILDRLKTLEGQYTINKEKSFQIGCGIMKHQLPTQVYELIVSCSFGVPLKVTQTLVYSQTNVPANNVKNDMNVQGDDYSPLIKTILDRVSKNHALANGYVSTSFGDLKNHNDSDKGINNNYGSGLQVNFNYFFYAPNARKSKNGTKVDEK